MIGLTPSVTVDPKEERRLEVHAVDGEVNNVRVFDDPTSVVPLYEWQIPVDCSSPGGTSVPVNPAVPRNTAVLAPRFTG